MNQGQVREYLRASKWLNHEYDQAIVDAFFDRLGDRELPCAWALILALLHLDIAAGKTHIQYERYTTANVFWAIKTEIIGFVPMMERVVWLDAFYPEDKPHRVVVDGEHAHISRAGDT